MSPTHYAAIAIANCKEAEKERIANLNDMLIQEYSKDSAFSELFNKEWKYVEKVFTHPTIDFNVIRVVLEWIADEVGKPADKLIEESEKNLFLIRTPNGPKFWAVAHYFRE